MNTKQFGSGNKGVCQFILGDHICSMTAIIQNKSSGGDLGRPGLTEPSSGSSSCTDFVGVVGSFATHLNIRVYICTYICKIKPPKY